MLTTSHIAIGYLLFKKQSATSRWLVVVGSILPDITFLLVVPWLFITNSDYLMQSIATHTDIYVTNIDFFIGQLLNSAWLWLTLIFLGKKWPWLLPFSVGGLVHILVDLLTHQGNWAWNHLYPLKVMPFQGIIDASNPWFFVPVHIIWLIVFSPSVYLFFRKKLTTQ